MKYILTLFLGLATILLATQSAWAGETTKRDLPTLLKLADQHSPMITAARERVKMAEARVPQAVSLKDPIIGAKYYNVPAPDIWNLPNANMVMYQFSQEFPFPLKLLARREEAEHHLSGEREMLRMTELMVHADVKRIYFDLWSVGLRTRSLQSSLDALKRMEQLAETRYRSGTGTLMDVLKLQVEAVKLQAELETDKLKRNTLQFELAQAIGKPASPDFSVEPFPTLPLGETPAEGLAQMALLFRPEVQIKHHEVTKMKAEYRLAVLDWFPDLMFMVEPRAMGTSVVGQDVTFSINIPLWGLTKQRPAASEMYAKVLEAEAMLAHAQNQTRTDVADAYEKAKGAELRVALYRESAIPKAQTALRLAERLYESGKISFIDLLDTVRMLRTQEMEYAMAVEDLGMHIGHLETIIGQEVFLGGESR